MSVARDQLERDGVHIHLARWNREVGNYDEARRHLNIITNAIYDVLKERLFRSISEEEAEARGERSPEPEAEEAAPPD
jgi:hypothetical protein